MRVSFLGIVVAVAPLSTAAENAPAEMAIGQVIDPAPGDVIDGWQNWSGSNFSRRARANDAIVETRECCTSIFFRGNSYLIVRTVRISKDDVGSAFGLKGRIVETLRVDTEPGDELMECNLLWIQPAANFWSKRTNLMRSYVVTDNGIQLIRWIDDHDWCYIEDRN
jgi:hypothetical protein